MIRQGADRKKKRNRRVTGRGELKKKKKARGSVNKVGVTKKTRIRLLATNSKVGKVSMQNSEEKKRE